MRYRYLGMVCLSTTLFMSFVPRSENGRNADEYMKDGMGEKPKTEKTPSPQFDPLAPFKAPTIQEEWEAVLIYGTPREVSDFQLRNQWISEQQHDSWLQDPQAMERQFSSQRGYFVRQWQNNGQILSKELQERWRQQPLIKAYWESLLAHSKPERIHAFEYQMGWSPLSDEEIQAKRKELDTSRVPQLQSSSVLFQKAEEDPQLARTLENALRTGDVRRLWRLSAANQTEPLMIPEIFEARRRLAKAEESKQQRPEAPSTLDLQS